MTELSEYYRVMYDGTLTPVDVKDIPKSNLKDLEDKIRKEYESFINEMKERHEGEIKRLQASNRKLVDERRARASR